MLKLSLSKKRFICNLLILLILSLSFTVFVPTLVNSSTEYFKIMNIWNGKYLFEGSGQLKYGLPSEDDYTYQWELQEYNGNTKIKNRSTGNYINIKNQKSYVESTAISGSSISAEWKIEDYNNNKRIKSAWKQDKYINVEMSPGFAKCSAIQEAWVSAQWFFEKVGGVVDASITNEQNLPNELISPSANRGANVPYITYEAETAKTNGTVLGPNTKIGDPAGEASGHMAVNLDSTGEYVEWTVTAPCNALVVRYSMPDAPKGGGINSTLSIYKNGIQIQDLKVTSKYAWLYGEDAWSQTGLTQNPKDKYPRRIYDESSELLTKSFNTGDVIKIKKDLSDKAAYYDIDFIELENVSPISRPLNSISITEKGAVAGGPDCAAAIEAAISDAKAKGKIVWIPQGTFYHGRKISASNVTIKGAGMWYSKLYVIDNSRYTNNSNMGFNVDSNAKFYDFQIFGEGNQRNSGGSGFSGPFGTGSELHNIWVEHTNTGVWEGIDNSRSPGSNLIFEGCRFRDTYADGINMCNGTQNSVIKNCNTRNTGDDGIAIWSESEHTKRCSYNNYIINCTAQLPWRAAGIAVYGGKSNNVLNNKITDTMTYPGLTISSGFKAMPFAGVTTFMNNDLIRCGGAFWKNNAQYGAIWLNPSNSDFAGTINFIGNRIFDAVYSGVHIQSKNEKAITGTITFDDLEINGTGTYGILIDPDTSGNITFKNTKMTGIGKKPYLKNDSEKTFKIIKGEGNVGW
jgi:hypothetical protein